ncbi:outer membrane protein OmpK [Thalassotalea crassostreae]|uniref:outer membrane protein OmpK n=1 Tax=Thalassotalea crassostreae TaxID=1763536 RepID=UPI000838B8AF|nr:outer membrane protein OmpK [Thalassotalea crassostreae]
MNTTLKKVAALAVAGASLTTFNANAEMFWSDNSITLLKNTSEFEINKNDDVAVVTLEHASGHNWGDLFFFADRLEFKEDSNYDEAKETYSELSPRLSLSYATGSKLQFGMISDVFVATTWEHSSFTSPGFNQSFDNYLVGVGVDLKVSGFAFLNANVYQANNELIDNDTQLTVAWGYPFSVGNADFMFDGYIDWSSAEETHAADFHFNPQLRMDIGKYFGAPKKFEAGVEYSYWVNKFGAKVAWDQAVFAPVAVDDESVISLIVKVHL